MQPSTWHNSVWPTPLPSTLQGVGAQVVLRARHYHRRERAISLAACVAAETARALNASVASADPHLLDMCRDEGIAVLALPDGNGDTWTPEARRRP
jgi:hypothetical protein